MATRKHIRRVALYGPFGWGNLGDAAIQDSMIANIRARLPEVEFVGWSLNPENTEEIHGIPAMPIERSWAPRRKTGGNPNVSGPMASAAQRLPPAPVRWVKRVLRPLAEFVRELRFLARGMRVLRSVDVFVVSGGGQLCDFWGGPFYHPFLMLEWVLCARLAGCEVHVVSVGAGPIDHSLTNLFLSWAMRLAHSRSYRDIASHALVSRWGFTREDAVHPDAAFGHPRRSARREDPAAPNSVAVSPLCYCHPKPGPWPTQDAARYERYLGIMRGFTEEVLDSGRPVTLLISQIRNDRYAFDDLVEQLADRGYAEDPRLDATPTENLQHILDQIDGVDIVVTSRLHGVILAYLLHKPVIALSYDPKLDAVMRAFGMSEFCLDIDTTTPEQLRERFATMVARYPEIRSSIRTTAEANRASLDVQFDRLFGAAPTAAQRRVETLGAVMA